MNNTFSFKALKLIIIKNNIRYYCDLMDYLYDHDLFELYKVACLECDSICRYINSRNCKHSK